MKFQKIVNFQKKRENFQEIQKVENCSINSEIFKKKRKIYQEILN